LVELERFAAKSASNLVASIDRSRRPTLARFLFALGIRHVGEEVARVIAAQFQTLDAFLQADWAGLLVQKAQILKENAKRRTRGEPLQPVPLEGVGPEIVTAISNFLSEAHNREAIDDLRQQGVEPATAAQARGPATGTTGARSTNPAQVAAGPAAPGDGRPTAAAAGQVLAGRTVVITGTLSRIARGEAQDLIRSLGGHSANSVSKKTDFVVAGEAAGSKLDKARALGVRVLDEDSFFRMIENGSDSST
jgi:DNA ligase (NAD+)